MKKVLLIILVVLTSDIISKQLIINYLIEDESITIIKNIFNITYAKNTGIAFSLFEGKKIIIIIITIIVIIALLKYLKHNHQNNIEIISYSLILGGSIGNLIDRLIYGYVIDFLDFHIYNNHFPTFNIADSSIVIGIITALLLSKKEGEQDDNKSRSQRKNR